MLRLFCHAVELRIGNEQLAARNLLLAADGAGDGQHAIERVRQGGRKESSAEGELRQRERIQLLAGLEAPRPAAGIRCLQHDAAANLVLKSGRILPDVGQVAIGVAE